MVKNCDTKPKTKGFEFYIYNAVTEASDFEFSNYETENDSFKPCNYYALFYKASGLVKANPKPVALKCQWELNYDKKINHRLSQKLRASTIKINQEHKNLSTQGNITKPFLSCIWFE